MGQLRDKRMRWVRNLVIVWHSHWMCDGWQDDSHEFNISFLTFRAEVLCLVVAWNAWDENSQQSAVVSAVMTEINMIITNNLQVSGSLRPQYLLVCWHLLSGDFSIAVGFFISEQEIHNSCNGFAVLLFGKTYHSRYMYCCMKEVLVSWYTGIHREIIFKHKLTLHSADSWQISPTTKWWLLCSSLHENSSKTAKSQTQLKFVPFITNRSGIKI